MPEVRVGGASGTCTCARACAGGRPASALRGFRVKVGGGACGAGILLLLLLPPGVGPAKGGASSVGTQGAGVLGEATGGVCGWESVLNCGAVGGAGG